MDELELRFQSSGTSALIAISEDIKSHWISLRPRVVFENLKALMSSQSLCGTARPDSLHKVHEVQILDDCREL